MWKPKDLTERIKVPWMNKPLVTLTWLYAHNYIYIYIYENAHIYLYRPIYVNTYLITYGSTGQMATWKMCVWAFEQITY